MILLRSGGKLSIEIVLQIDKTKSRINNPMNMSETDSVSAVLAKELFALIMAQEHGHYRFQLLDTPTTLAAIKASLLGLLGHGEHIFDITRENWALARYIHLLCRFRLIELARLWKRKNALNMGDS